MELGKPRIIVFDIETLPNLRQVLKYLPRIDDWPGSSLKATINSVLCIGWKELGKKKVNMIRAWDGPNWKTDKNDDRYVLQEFLKIIKAADGVVTQNGKKFDWKFIQTRLLFHGLETLPTIPHMDTKALAKGNLFTIGNRLNDLAELTASEKKIENGGWELWEKIWLGCERSLSAMEKYCKQDVKTLEQVFLKLRPFVKNMPNHNLWSLEGTRCPTCGSLSLIKNGMRTTTTQRYQRLLCTDCGSSCKLALRDKFVRPC
jgi:DNA polymerase elongation subunit (family B)/DNA-directed RNA polymerase subunit RPC12/RpoP